MSLKFLKDIDDQLFITTDMDRQKEIFRWSPPKEIETRFGVEVEACIRAEKGCIGIYADFFDVLPKKFTFKDKFDLYYKTFIVKSPYFRRLAKEYRYLYVVDKEVDGTEFFYDMQNPQLLGLSERDLLKIIAKEEQIDMDDLWNPLHGMPNQMVEQILKRARNYELPMFVDDLSIRCGDTKNKSNRAKAGITAEDKNSLRFECITPILTVKGTPTKEKIKKAMVPILSLFGLHKPKCFIVNFSMGFHVNVSLYNTKYGKYVGIAESPFLNQLLRNYIKVERLIYSDVRKRKPLDAPNDFISVFARPLYKNLDQFKTENPKLTEDQIIDTIMMKKDYMNEKYKGLKRKSPYLLEFRLFEGDNSIDRLTNHVFVALDIVHKTATQISEKTKKSLEMFSEKSIDYFGNNLSPESDPNRINGYFSSLNSPRHVTTTTRRAPSKSRKTSKKSSSLKNQKSKSRKTSKKSSSLKNKK